MNPIELGEYLRKLRGERSTRQVENYTNVSKSYISLLEQGKRHPSPEVLKKLSTCYGVTYEELMEACGYLDPEPKDSDIPLNSDIRILSRAQRKMTPEQLTQLKKIAQSLFSKAFDDDEQD